MASLKTCFKCGVTKPLGDFHKHPQMGDGHLNKCKECANRDVRENRLKRIEQYRAYDLNRASRPKRAANTAKYVRRWRETDPRRNAAQHAVSRAKRAGKLTPQACFVCGAEERIHAHHSSYDRSMWLEVTWLCAVHHKRLHDDFTGGVNIKVEL